MHNYESVVGPVKGVYNQSIGVNKPRGHSLLVAERPNFVTILALGELPVYIQHKPFL
jgi:nuclear factor related to kappa-B-binding protein